MAKAGTAALWSLQAAFALEYVRKMIGNQDLVGHSGKTAARKPQSPFLSCYLKLTIEIRSVRGEDIV